MQAKRKGDIARRLLIEKLWLLNIFRIHASCIFQTKKHGSDHTILVIIASAYAQTRQSLRCSCIISMVVDKGSDQNHRPLALLGMAAQAFVRVTGAYIMFFCEEPLEII